VLCNLKLHLVMNPLMCCFHCSGSSNHRKLECYRLSKACHRGLEKLWRKCPSCTFYHNFLSLHVCYSMLILCAVNINVILTQSRMILWMWTEARKQSPDTSKAEFMVHDSKHTLPNKKSTSLFCFSVGLMNDKIRYLYSYQSDCNICFRLELL
jgi:hypothetical protein